MANAFDWTKHISSLDAYPSLSSLWEKELAAELKKYCSQICHPDVLEIGCSNGKWLNWFEENFHATPFGVDINAVGSESVRNFYEADAHSLPFKDGTFDIVYSLGLIEHFESQAERGQVIKEHVRVAKEGTGIIVIFHPVLDLSLDRFFIRYYYDYKQGYKHYAIKHRETLKHFQDNGVRILSTQWNGWVVPSVVGVIEKKIRLMLGIRSPQPERFYKKLFNSPLTAENFLAIGVKN